MSSSTHSTLEEPSRKRPKMTDNFKDQNVRPANVKASESDSDFEIEDEVPTSTSTIPADLNRRQTKAYNKIQTRQQTKIGFLEKP